MQRIFTDFFKRIPKKMRLKKQTALIFKILCVLCASVVKTYLTSATFLALL